LGESLATVIIPFDECIIFVRFLNCAELPGWLSEVAQPRDAITWIQFIIRGRRFGERWPLRAI
jgi:hypothetical protein